MRVSLLLVVVGLALALGACSGPPGDGNFRSGVVDDGGMCVRNLETLTDLLTSPESCVSSESCPPGSFCNETQGACDWECYADSDCGVGGVCSCEGRCLNGDAGPLVSADPTCERDEDLLLTVAAAPRDCTFDEDCPHGSRCDASSGTCAWTCLGTAHPTAGCDPGETCDCFGRCVEESVSPGASSAPRVRLEVADDVLVVVRPTPTTAWNPRRVDVALATEDQVLAAGAAGTVVELRAEDGLLVSCDATTPSNGTYGASCAIGPPTTGPTWLFELNGAVHRATRSVWVMPAVATQPEWRLHVSSATVAGAPRMVVIRVPSADVTPPPLAGEYRGTVTLLGITDLAAGPEERPTTPLSLPVRGWRNGATGGGEVLDLVEPLGLLSATGKLRLGGATSTPVVYLDPTVEGHESSGAMTASVVLLAEDASTAGRISGTFEVRLPLDWDNSAAAVYRWRYTLARTGDTIACVTDAPCGDDTSCDVGRGICVAGEPWVAAAAAGNFVYFASEPWVTAVEERIFAVFGDGVIDLGSPTLFRGPTGMANLYDEATGVASASSATHHAIIAAEALASWHPPKDAYRACKAAIATWAGSGFYTARVLDNGVYLALTDATICDRLYTVAAGAATEATIDLGRANDMIPCVHATPLTSPAPTGRLASANGSIGWDGTCQRVHANALESNWPGVSTTSSTFTTYLANDCFALGERYVLQSGGTEDRHTIYLCENYRTPLLSRHGAAAMAERALCHDPDLPPAGAVGIPLRSSEFSTSELFEISGEPVCGNGRPPHGVDLLTREDVYTLLGIDVVTPPSDLVNICLDDLAATPPPMGGATLEEDFAEVFETRTCFSPAQYHLALAHLVNGYFDGISDYRVPQLYQGLLAQWIRLHGFLAEETANEAPLAQVLQYDPDLGIQAEAASAPSMAAVLDRQLRGWEMILNVDHLQPLRDTPETTILWTDYRLVAGEAHHEQGVGLPAVMLDGAVQHLELARRYATQIELESYAECLAGGSSTVRDAAMARLSAALRYTTAIEGVATALYDEATARTCVAGCAAGTTCGAEGRCEESDGTWYREEHAWRQRWDDGQEQLHAVRARLVEEAIRLDGCASPFGIERGEVPLFFGDAVGDSSRFFAASDHLVNGWAVPAVASASTSLNEARTAWLQRRDSDLQQTMSDLDRERRLEELAARYGAPLIDACGLVGVESKDAVAMFLSGELDPGSCYIDTSREICTIDASTVYAWLAEDDPRVRFDLCYLHEMLGDGDDEQQNLAEGWATATVDLDLGGSPPQPTVTANGVTMPLPSFFMLAKFARGMDQSDRGAVALATCIDDPMFGGAEHHLPRPEDGDPHIADRADCYRGQLGEALLAMAAADKDMEIAHSSWVDSEEAYRTQVDFCIDQESVLMYQAALQAGHTAHMNSLAEARRKAEQARSAGNLFSNIVSFRFGDALTSIRDGINFIEDLTGVNLPQYLECVLIGPAVCLLNENPEDIALAMEQAQRDHDLLMAQVQQQLTTMACFHEADMHKIGIDTAALRIERASVDVKIALARFVALQRSMLQTIAEGHAAVSREEGRVVPQIAFHYWLDERVERFTRDFAWAKQLTFLALRAAEYEFQQSLGVTDEVATATHPDQLLDAIQAIQQEQLTRTINSRRPEESVLVLSLRDEILRLDDRNGLEDGEREWSAQLRFQQRLWSPEYAVHDGEGTYLGQGIPFTLDERGPLELRCAERMWDVTATIQGDLLDQSAPSASVFLIKQNSFGSQWCDGRGDGSAYQVGSMPPTSRLFHPEDRGGSEAAGITHTTAMLQPYFNERRSDFYLDAYEQGASDELAGRGLYGDYILLFPWHGMLEDGFALEQVEDVLLRFDYLSIDDITF